MSSYYYLMSSLPLLKAEGEMPFSYESFVSSCRGNVNESRIRMLEELTLDSAEGPFLSEWAKFYGVLHGELTYQRNVRLGKANQLPTERDELITRAVTAAINEPNPLEAEKALLKLQFEKLDELVSLHYFDECALVGYALKLKLLERKTVFQHDSGKAEFDRIATGLQEQIRKME